MKPVLDPVRTRRSRTEVLDELRRVLPRMEGFAANVPHLSFGDSALDSHLPQGGLAYGALHEIVPATDGDMPIAFGFATALLRRTSRDGPLLFVMPSRAFARYGRPYGHGLNTLGLDPARVILIETGDEKQTLWAIEEILRSAAPAGVAGAIDDLDLKTSQRLHLIASDSRLPFLLLRPARTLETSAAATRWRIGAAEAARDRFGHIARWRWHLCLERCRNGRPGEWFVEFDHVAHRFSLASPMADPALPFGASAQPALQACRS